MFKQARNQLLKLLKFRAPSVKIRAHNAHKLLGVVSKNPLKDPGGGPGVKTLVGVLNLLNTKIFVLFTFLLVISDPLDLTLWAWAQLALW